MELVTVQKCVGKYDWAHPEETQIKYIFYGVPKNICVPAITFDEDWRFDLEVDCNLQYTPLDFAVDLLEISKKYFIWSTYEEKLQKIIEYLRQNEDEQRKLFTQKLYRDAIFKREELLDKIARVEEDIEELSSALKED